MSHTYTELYYHFVWRTKKNAPYLTPELEPAVFGYMRKRCVEMGVFVYALNGMPDHVHLVCSIPTRVSVGEVIKTLKGATSHYITHSGNPNWTLYWQEGYGGLTFAKANLKTVVDYVDNQKIHHTTGPLKHKLER